MQPSRAIKFRAILALSCLVLSGLGTSGLAASGVLAAKDIMEQVVRRSGPTNDLLILTNYHFVRWEVSEELDKKGVATKRQEKIYDHSPAKSYGVLREIRENGKIIPKSDSKASEKPEERERKGKGKGRSGRGGGGSVELTADLLKRFDFQLQGQTNFNGHGVYSIRFAPAAKLESPKNMNEKVLQKIRGTLLVETNSFQIVRLEAELFDDLSFWGGMLGSLSEFRLLLIREPVDGIWFNRVITGEYEARAVLNSMHGRFSSTNSSFQKRELVPSFKAAPAK